MAGRRRRIPDRVKLIAALARFGLRVEQVEFDHTPPLELREVDEETGLTIPHPNDPLFIQMLLVDEHRTKTFGRGGEKRASVADGDLHKIAKSKRLAKAQAAFEEARRQILKVEDRKPKKRRLKSRGFSKRGGGK